MHSPNLLYFCIDNFVEQVCLTKLSNERQFEYLIYLFMTEEITDTAERIQKAAEDEFLEKGYGNAKMMSIAERAGVSHSMLHYYYRSKENLFEKFFDGKIKVFAEMLEGVSKKGLTIEETIKELVFNQFEVIRADDRFAWFMVNEILPNPKNLEKVIEMVKPTFSAYYTGINEYLQDAVNAGKIRKIDLRTLIQNIVGMNLASFFAIPVIRRISPEMDIDKYLDERKKSNAEFILAALRP